MADTTTTDEMITLAYEYMNFKDKDSTIPLYISDLYFILPTIKKAISLNEAIANDISNKRLLAATILSRTLIEVVVNLLYVANINKVEKFYEKFLEHDRLRVYRDKKGWEKVTISSQIQWVEDNYHITRLGEVYDNCSKLVHFSSSAAQLIINRNSMSDGAEMGIIVSANEAHFDEENFNELAKTTAGMMVMLKTHIRSLIDGKKLKIARIEGVEPDA